MTSPDFLPNSAFDVFLSYNSDDYASVRQVRQFLRVRGIATFLDRESLVAGSAWPEELERALSEVRAVAVFIGRHLGGWQKREMAFALDRQVREEKEGRGFPVIPILLPGADLTPGFLFLNTWIDLRNGLDSVTSSGALDLFEGAVRSTSPVSRAEPNIAFCPYRGLRAFREEDAAFFAGRDAYSYRLLELTLGKKLVALVGPSGSGKSSIVHAGLLPMLRRLRPPESSWDAVTFTPGKEPFHRLASALIPLLEPDLNETKRLVEAQELGDSLAAGNLQLAAVLNRVLTKSNGTGRLLLVADQFEELFTLTPAEERGPFIDRALCAVEDTEVTLLLTIRADFYAHVIGLGRDISDRLLSAQVNIAPLTEVELEECIRRPAELVGLRFEAGLIERILADVRGEPGYLPLTEFALTELWQRRQGALLTHRAYDEIKGVAGALTRRADAEFVKFTEKQADAARRVFGRLVRVAKPEEGGEDTRQPVDLTGADSLTQEVVRALAHADVRLLVTSGDERTGREIVEVVHEALIRNWQRLRGWLNEDREFLLWRRRLEEHVDEWEAHERNQDLLLRGAPLSEAEQWIGQRKDYLRQNEQSYIEESLQARRQEHLREHARRRRRAMLLIGITGVLVVLSASLFQLWRRSEKARNISLARQLAAAAELIIQNSPRDLELGALLAAESMRRHPLVDNERPLRQALALLPRILRSNPAGERVTRYSWGFSPDGAYVLFSGNDSILHAFRDGREIWSLAQGGLVSSISIGGRYSASATEKTVKVFDLLNGSELAVFQHAHVVATVMLSPDGRYLATVSGELPQEPDLVSGRVDKLYARVFDVAVRKELPLIGNTEISHAVLTKSGRYLVVAEKYGNIRVFDLPAGRQVATILPPTDVFTLDSSPDDHYVVITGDDLVDRVYETQTGQQVRWIGSDLQAIAFSSRGEYIATGTHRGVHVYRVSNHAEISNYDHGTRINALAFSADGRYLASGAGDGTARLIDLELGEEVSRLQQPSAVWSVALSTDGRYIATGGDDGTARIFATENGRELSRAGHEYAVGRVTFNETGRYIGTGLGHGIVFSLGLDIETVKLERLGSDPNVLNINNVNFTPNGTHLIVGLQEDTVRIFETVSGQELGRYPGHNLATIPDTSYIATGGFDGLARVVDVRTRRQIAIFVHPTIVTSVSLSRDGQYLATLTTTGTVRIFDVSQQRQLTKFEDESSFIAFHPDERHLLFQTARGIAIVDARSPKSMEYISTLTTSFVISDDGRYLATTDVDNRVSVWDIRTRRRLLRLSMDGWMARLAFSRAAQYLAVASNGLWGVETRIYRLPDGQEISRQFSRGRVEAVSFSDDARVVNTAAELTDNADNTVLLSRQWLFPNDLLAQLCSLVTRNLTLEEWSRYVGDDVPYRPTCSNLPRAVPEQSTVDANVSEPAPTSPSPTQSPSELKAPVLLEPDNMTVFHHYPRETTLRWSPVTGAASYSVQVDFCTATDAWISSGGEWCEERPTPVLVARNLTTTSYTFGFVGASPGRWRVWAVDRNGTEGPKSTFRVFRYTR